jgi:enhancing lycopene biosynthesis protein 2
MAVLQCHVLYVTANSVLGVIKIVETMHTIMFTRQCKVNSSGELDDIEAWERVNAERIRASVEEKVKSISSKQLRDSVARLIGPDLEELGIVFNITVDLIIKLHFG